MTCTAFKHNDLYLDMLIDRVYYPQEVSSMKYCCLGVYLGTSGLSLKVQIENKTLEYWYSWVVKKKKTPQRQYSAHNTPLGHHTDRSPMGFGQYNSLGEYCGLHTAISVFLILLRIMPVSG